MPGTWFVSSRPGLSSKTLSTKTWLLLLRRCAVRDGHSLEKLAKFLKKAMPLQMEEKAKLLSENESLFKGSEAAACEGDTEVWKPGAQYGASTNFKA